MSVSAQAAIKKEVWNCELQGHPVFSGTFTQDSSMMKLTDKEVELSFKQPNQKSALNGSVKTEIKGLEEGWDTIDYKITLVRTKPEEFSSNGPAYEKLNATATVVYDGLYDCIGFRVDVEVLNCSVEVFR